MKTPLHPPSPRQASTPASVRGFGKTMGTSGGPPPSLSRSRYVSRCVDLPTPVTTALAATEELFSHPDHQSAGSGSIPRLLLSPPEPSGGETAFSNQPPHPTFTKGTCQQAFGHAPPSQLHPCSSSALHSTNEATNGLRADGADDDGEGGREGNLRPPRAENRSHKDPCLLPPEAERFLLPRSSPVITMRHRPVSWHGPDTGTSSPSSLDSRSPAPSSLSLDRRVRPAVASMEDLGSGPRSGPHLPQLQREKKQRRVTVSSHLSHFLTSLLHPPFAGREGLAEERKGRHPTSCQPPHTPGVSASAELGKQRRCSDIPEVSTDIFKTSCDLEKENAHFIVVDMVLEVLEAVKWSLGSDQRASTTDTHRCGGPAGDSPAGDSPAGDSPVGDGPTREHALGCDASRRTQTEEEETGSEEPEHQRKTFSVLFSDSGFEDCGGDAALTPKDSLRNAERLAQQLVLEFRRSWLPSRDPRCGRHSLRSSLQELPGTGGVVASGVSLEEEIRLRTRMRGSLSWAPPRFQIIFSLHPTQRRSNVMALQNFLCAGCGTEVEPRYIKKLRYCEYLGRYFCDCCHSGAEAVIPARVLTYWDFSRFPVSDFSKQLLDSVWLQPLFDLSCVGKTIYGRVKELDRFRELQVQLLGIKTLLKTCRLSERAMTEFQQLPSHLVSEPPHLFSMDDLLRVKRGQLVMQARAVLQSAVAHIENCELCLARGFICEFCREKDVIFPFQSDICLRCPVCKACFHKRCFVERKCPKCARIQSRKKHPYGSMKCDG